jgi:hypothetical protein
MVLFPAIHFYEVYRRAIFSRAKYIFTSLSLSKKHLIYFACRIAGMPAKAGIHVGLMHSGKWMPAFAGMTACAA